MSFKPTGYSEKIFKLRYALTQDETFVEASRRVSDQVAKAELPEKQQKVSDEFFNMISENLFMPGGRIWYGSGRAKPSMLNCFVVPAHDSREDWGKLICDTIIISGLGGGIGIPFSKIRPKGELIRGTGGTASGPVSLMRIVNAAAEEIRNGGSRRAALMMALSYTHPDIDDFLNAKLDLDQLNNANVSVIIDNEFLDKVEENKDVELIFAGKTYGKLKANSLFDRLLENAVNSGEPGILNMGYANEMNNIAYERNLICTNPCGELPLAKYQSCCLGSIVLPRFVDENHEFDFDALDEIIPTIVRFLDNVLDVNHYPLNEIEVETKKFRRLGIGILGLHDTLLKMNIKYSSAKGYKFVDRLMKFIKKRVYEASTYLAVEKGSFPGFKRDPYLEGNFIQTLPKNITSKIKQYGIRNSALMTIAPTGTTGIVCGFSGGVEPLFSYAYKRTWTDQDENQNSEIVIHPLFEEFIKNNRDVSHFESSHEISVEDHIKMQYVCQKHVDGAISKTINLPSTYTTKDLKPIILKYLKGLKGLTVYRDGSRGVSPLMPLDIEEAKEHVAKEHITAAKEQNCAGGKCEL